MKKTNWLTLAGFAVAAALLRVLQDLTGFEESGLAKRGNLPGVLLVLVLISAAAYFFAVSRRLPARREGADLAGNFAFEGMAAVFCVVAGAFLVMVSGVASVIGGSGALKTLLLAIFAIAAGVGMLYAAFALYRGGETPGLALLIPVCALIAHFIVLYRVNSSDPVLARIYVETLAVAGLMLAAVELAAFAFRIGSPRMWLPVTATAVVLSLTVAADRQSLASLVLYVGSALIGLGFLASARFEEP